MQTFNISAKAVKELREQAKELIAEGNSREKMEGHGIERVLRQLRRSKPTKKEIIELEDLTIGSKVYAVHKKYVDGKLGGTIKVTRVKTFRNTNGVIEPVLTEIGNVKVEIDPQTHYIYLNLFAAIEAIKTKR